MTQTIERSPAQRIAIVLAVCLQIGATFLPQLGLGEPIGERSDSTRTLITPAGWAFAIWGPLFLGSAVFAVWQALPRQRRNALVHRIGWWAAIALAAQGVWAIYTQFASLTFVSVIIIATSLVALLVILSTLVRYAPAFTGFERWIVALVFSALAAWLTAATIVNVSASLVYHGIGGGLAYPQITAVMVLVGGLIAALAVHRSKGNPWYAGVFCWALAAIYLRGGQQSDLIALACAAAAVLVVIATLAGLRDPANRRRWFG
ncbi:hypothetical protein U4960_14865 [Altererythrobacter sp. H2]|uniref:hypothetical protein n=1 Tax=Altererythrobacter sp. H2 TaxID=3108391 RepID=UPI002B4BC07C|nr:hypothetical protein [Altererythrobacter sp. H2]WRK95543.1 hypothetical protein U4960_14865 [Altererythrobacter sp. H2]